VSGQDGAVLVGFNEGTADLRLVTVDLTDTRNPKVVGSLPLASNQVDVRSRLLVRDDVVFVGGPNGTLLINIADALHPRVMGEADTVAGNLALANDMFLFGVGTPLTPSQTEGVHVAVVNPGAFVPPISPTVTRELPETNPLMGATVRDFTLYPRMFPP